VSQYEARVLAGDGPNFCLFVLFVLFVAIFDYFE